MLTDLSPWTKTFSLVGQSQQDQPEGRRKKVAPCMGKRVCPLLKRCWPVMSFLGRQVKPHLMAGGVASPYMVIGL